MLQVDATMNVTRPHFDSQAESLPSFDMRPQSELSETIVGHPDRIERERALWELGHRRSDTFAPILQQVLRAESDPSIRANALALALQVAPVDAPALLESALRDDDREVRDWACHHLRRLTGATAPDGYSGVVYTEKGVFDQTMPLHVAGFALLHAPGLGWMRVTLSPLWFEQIMGRVLACTRVDTFFRELTLETCLANYHHDGTNHYEIFRFAGVAWSSAKDRVQHRYESTGTKKFFFSGKVDDRTKGVLDVPFALHRVTETSTVAVKSLPRLEGVDPSGRRKTRLLTGSIASAVRGQFSAFAHTSVEQYTRHGKVLPGTVQLANPAEPASLVNSYLCGTLWGKLADHDGDGKIDLNTIPCRGLTDGHVDDSVALPPDFPA